MSESPLGEAMTTPTDPVEVLAELRELEKAATPGPWAGEAIGSEGYIVYAPPGSRLARQRVAACTWLEWETDKANAALIAALRNAAPLLLSPDHTLVSTAELESLRAVAEAARLGINEQGQGLTPMTPEWVHAMVALRDALARLTEPGKP